MHEETDFVLDSIKDALNICGEHFVFDPQIKMHINSIFSTLHQMGAGPSAGFRVETGEETWSEFSSDSILIGLVKDYIFMRTKIVFDPPTSSFVLDALQKNADELAWRINCYVDPGTEEEDINDPG